MSNVYRIFIFSVIFVIVSVVRKLITYRTDGWAVLRLRALSSLILGFCFTGGGYIYYAIYPSLDDYWKLTVSCILILTIVTSAAGAMMFVGDKIDKLIKKEKE